MSKIIGTDGKEYNFTGHKIFTEQGWQYASFFMGKIINNWIKEKIYNTGDAVFYNNQNWISIIDGNTWTPGDEGWEVLK